MPVVEMNGEQAALTAESAVSLWNKTFPLFLPDAQVTCYVAGSCCSQTGIDMADNNTATALGSISEQDFHKD